MGIPHHYSLELPDRCLALLKELTPFVEMLPDSQGYSGPLTTTLLLSLATPMIVLPVERLLKQVGDQEGNADDRHVDAAFAERVRKAFGPAVKFGHSPFFSPKDGWSYAFTDPNLNIARGLPNEIADELGAIQATEAAAALDAAVAIRAVRNALAHGVIAYLDADGRSIHGGKAEMLALVGECRQNRRVVGLHILRIPESGFRSFLHRWVNWLNQSQLTWALPA